MERHYVRAVLVMGTFAASALVVLASLAVYSVVVDDGSAAETSNKAVSSTTAQTPPLNQNVVSTTAPPPVLMGWGASQPTQMRATVKYGTTTTTLSPERRELLSGQLVRVRKAVMAVGTVAQAEKLGYVKNFQFVEGRGYEYINWGYWSKELNLERPTMLVFPDTKPDTKVISVAYNVLGNRKDGPPTDLPLEVMPWHFHHDLCRKGDSIIGNVETAADGSLYQDQIDRCVDEGATFEPELDHWMIDLWIVPGWENPWGLVSSKHPDMFTTPQAWFPDAAAGTHHS